MPPDTVTSTPQKKPFTSILFWAALIACLYLPTLATPFDFIDDGNLVYPSHEATLAGKVDYYWKAVVANYEDLGPFRPTLWVHWRLEAELFNANPLLWRAERLVFTFLATVALLLLLVELRIAWPAALFTAALAMWNPYRNEIWTSLTLSEGVAMPYAVMALFCALRAARSQRAWRWDIAGLLCMLVALGCKNTFAVVIPAQLFFRVSPDGRNLAEGVKKNWLRAGVLSLALLLPVGHYLYFISHWHPGQYPPGGNPWKQFIGMLNAEKGAVTADYMAAGYILAIVAVIASGTLRACGKKVWADYRAPLIGGAMLLVLGVGIYLKIDGICGRYSIPAVWGLDFWIGILLSVFVALPKARWKVIACVALCVGIVAVAISNLGRQARFAARAKMLWQVVHYFEGEPPGRNIAWMSSRNLDIEEGIHVAWHLKARGHAEEMRLFNANGIYQDRRELSAKGEIPRLSDAKPSQETAASATTGQIPDLSPDFAITAENQQVALPGHWKQVREFDQAYWFGKRHFACVLWEMIRE